MTTGELTSRYVLGNYTRFPVSFTRGEGSWLWDEKGRKYLDFGTGIAVCSLGHAPECMRRALSEQGARLIHCSNLYQIREQGLLAQLIVEQVMGTGGKVFFANSGAEANDGAVKVARKFFYDRSPNGKPERFEVITCRNSFHGRTLGGIASTGQDKVKVGFDPLLPGFLHVPFNDVGALRNAVSERTAAILFEPIQGEGGIHEASVDFFREADRIREETGILLMFDEVQCGFGRTGDWCAWRTLMQGSVLEVEPDVVTWAKGMGGGFPIGALWLADRVAGALGPGSHGSTFGGTPLGSAVARAVLEEIGASGCLENARNQEKRIRQRVERWDYPQIRGIRGRGLMLGFVLEETAFGKIESSPSLVLVERLMEQGLLVVPSGRDVVRCLPPLNVTADEVDTAMDILESVLSEMGESQEK